MTPFNFLKPTIVAVLTIGWATKLLAVPLTSEEVSQYATPATAKFNYFHTRHVINQNHVLYNSNDGTLTVNVLFENIDDIFFAENLRIYINGRDISEINPFNFQFSKSPPVAPDIYGEVGGEVNIPIGLDRNYPLVNLTTELIHDDTGVVIARNKIVMYETIWNSDIGFPEPKGAHEGYYYQLTGLGLGGESPHSFDGLETNLSDVFPAPSADDFSATFSDKMAAIPSQQEAGLKLCIDYDQLEDERFSDPQLFAAYQRAKTHANVIYTGFLACKAAGGGAVCRASCVRKLPKKKDFKLCVDTMTATPVEGAVEGPNTVQLEFLNSLRRDRALVGADVLMQNIIADVDIELSDLTVEWRKSRGICVLKPKARVQPDEIQSTDWLSAFTTCNATISADRAETKGNSGTSPNYHVEVNANNPDKLVATDSTLAQFEFYGTNENSAVGTCALDFVKRTAKELLESYTQPVLIALNDTFNANLPQTMLANLLTEALLPLELGSYSSALVDFDVEVTELYSSKEEGLVVNYASEMIPDLSLSRGNPIARYFSQFDNRFFPIKRSVDRYGYDAVSYTSMSTSWLNYLQWAKGFSSILNDTLEFSEAELGTSVYGIRTDTFGGEILKDVHPALKIFANEQIQVVMFRNFDPFFYITPDMIQTIPMVGSPLNYFIDEVRVQFKAPDTILANGDIIKGEIFIELVASLHETDFMLQNNATHGSVYLDTQVVPDPQFSSLFSKLKLDIIDFDIKDCPKYKHELGQISNACERQVESAIRDFLTPALSARLAQLVTDIPAPQFFSLQSEDAQSERQVSPQNRMQGEGRVSFSGVFE